MAVSTHVTLESVTAEDFAALLQQEFAVAIEDGGESFAGFVLTEAVERPSRGGREGRAPFSLVFTGPGDIVVEQGTLWMSHPNIGTLPIFLVPIGETADSRRYEAVFN